METSKPAASILIATFNRAAMLDDTLASIARLRPGFSWECIVIDNNSTDDTRAVVDRHAADFPVPLRYVFEARQGRSSALNTGIAAAGADVLTFTDDDVRVADRWLNGACGALLSPADPSIRFAGGPVRPRWEVPPPAWLDLDRGDLWGTIAIQDHGAERLSTRRGGRCLWARTWPCTAWSSIAWGRFVRISDAPARGGWCLVRRSRSS